MINLRVGHGLDFHKFDTSIGNHSIVIGGVLIPNDCKIIAHSDGDVLIHALVDAILGAIGMGDIGVHFPDTDAKWKDVNSEIFLKRATELMLHAGYKICNIDSILICEKPKISPYYSQIREHLAKILNISSDSINIKATTTEKMGFLGKKEGICADVTILCSK